MDDIRTSFELHALQTRYIEMLDSDKLEEWPTLFVEDCLYEILPKENEDRGLPIPVIRCDNIRMLRDRVISIREANIYQKPIYRHFFSILKWSAIGTGTVEMESNYLVVNTSQDGESSIYQVGVYKDRVVRTDDGW